MGCDLPTHQTARPDDAFDNLAKRNPSPSVSNQALKMIQIACQLVGLSRLQFHPSPSSRLDGGIIRHLPQAAIYDWISARLYPFYRSEKAG
jgi:hypothetical protein